MPYQPERHGPRRVVGPGFHARVWSAVARVPQGRVTTYGDVAAALGLRAAARQVGYALAALPPDRDDVPWHRVVSARGQLSPRGDGKPSPEQVRRLRREGTVVTRAGTVRDFAARRCAVAELGGGD
ncbi:MAG: MGMT family protein [Planctomycetota bacterium]